MVRLIGTRSNRNAIGARVRVTTGQVTQIREVQGGGSYLSQNDLRVHVGLGAAAVVDRVEVRWPNGLEEAWTGVAPDRLLTLREGEGKALQPMMPVLILVALLGAMQASPPSSLSPELTAVRTQILEGRSDSALEQLARMPADAPPVRYLTGLAYYHRDDHVRAIEYLAPVAQTLAAGSLERREAVQVLGLSYYLAAACAKRSRCSRKRGSGPGTTASWATCLAWRTSRRSSRTRRGRSSPRLSVSARRRPPRTCTPRSS